MKKKEYHNQLPSKYTSWAQFFLLMNLPGVIMHVSGNPNVNCLKFQMSKFSPDSDWLDATLTVDIEFLKARVFEDILKNSLITRRSVSKLFISDNIDPDSSQYRDMQDALNEIKLWAEVISQSRERPRNAVNPFGSQN